MKSLAIAGAMLVVLGGLAVTGRTMIDGQADKDAQDNGVAEANLVSPFDFEPIRADVINDTPHRFTIDVKKNRQYGRE